MGTGGSLPGVKRLGLEVNHSPSPSAKVKNEWSTTSTPPTCLHGVDRENFTFTSFLTSALPKGQGSASCYESFNTGQKDFADLRRGGWDPSFGDSGDKISCACRESKPILRSFWPWPSRYADSVIPANITAKRKRTFIQVLSKRLRTLKTRLILTVDNVKCAWSQASAAV
jgi:hypothetical protein